MIQKIVRVKISDLFSGYNETEDSIVGLSGALNIRPEFQREFVYNDRQQASVIDTVLMGYNLGLLTWFENDNGTFELGDGQQRTISICRYLSSRYPVSLNNIPKFFHNLPNELQRRMLDYELLITVVSGTAEEKLEWFKRINTAGVVLTEQELRNSAYTGPWLSSAKLYFSKPNCPAYNIGAKYLGGSLIRQDYLETALDWISAGDIEGYMALHQKDPGAEELWGFFETVLNWARKLFPTYRKEMKGLNWGRLFRTYGHLNYDPEILERKIRALMMDDDVTKKSGVYEFLLGMEQDERFLSIRTFTDSQKRATYEKQEGICPICGRRFSFEEMEGDHITPWSRGGRTEPRNLQMICKQCNRTKSNK